MPKVAKRWDVIAARYLLAFVFIVYGAFKIAGKQFGLGESLTHTTLQNTSPLNLTWYFFDYSVLYRDSIGLAQIVTGILLMIRRTAPIGALCFFVIIINIVLINIGYHIGIDVMIFSSILLAIDCLLLLHYSKRYRALLSDDDSPAPITGAADMN